MGRDVTVIIPTLDREMLGRALAQEPVDLEVGAGSLLPMTPTPSRLAP